MYDERDEADDGQQHGGDSPRLKNGGRYKARGFEWGLGHTSDGKPQVAICFSLLDDDYKGETITWFGSFSKNLGNGTKTPFQRTVETMRTCGWEGDDFSNLTGLDANEVSLVIEHEEYQGRTQVKVKWVNALGGIALKAPMTPEAAKAFAAKMKGELLALGKPAAAATSKPSKPPASKRNNSSDHPNAPGSTYGREPGADDDIPY